MKKKLILAVLLILGCTVAAFPQTKPRLGILPFVEGNDGIRGDGETIATLLSFQPEILETFTVVPRTSAVNTILAEQAFQLAGYTDSDTIAGIGRMLGADFVISGHIRQLGNRNLIIATMINVETFEQVAGYYRVYRNIQEVRNFMPSMARTLITASLWQDSSRLPSIAITPFIVDAPSALLQDSETLAQILAIEILNTGKYVVLPRTSTMQAALLEHEFQMRGFTADEEAVSLGRAINADFVLSIGIHSLADINMFMAQILHVQDGSLLAGAVREYSAIGEGIDLMAEIAILLTDPHGAEDRIAILRRTRSRAALFGDPAKFWSLGVFAGTSFIEPWLTTTIQTSLAPWRYSFFRLGMEVGFISGTEGVGFLSLYPFAHYVFFLPFSVFESFPSERGGVHIGIGGGYMIAEYRFDDFSVSRNTFVMDFSAGINFFDMLELSYTLQTDFSSIVNKLRVGFTHRFKIRR